MSLSSTNITERNPGGNVTAGFQFVPNKWFIKHLQPSHSSSNMNDSVQLTQSSTHFIHYLNLDRINRDGN